MAEAIRVFALSHSCVVPEYRLRHAEVAARGCAVTLLTPERWKQFNTVCVSPPAAAGHGYRLLARQPFCWGLLRHGLRNACHVYRGLTELLREARPDILELWEEPFFAVSWQAIRAFKKLNPQGKVIFFSAQNLPRRYPFPFAQFERYVYRRADMCFAMSDEVAGVIAARGWRGRSEVLPLGLDGAVYADLPPPEPLRERLGLREPVIGFAGRLDAEKGIGDLCAALERLSREGERFSALLVGDGGMRGEAEARLARLGVPCHSAGAVPAAEMPAYLNAMDVVVVPSRTTPKWKEQFGRVAAEAMAAAKAIVVSDSGELPNVVVAAGEIFPEGDVAALAAKLRGLLVDPARRVALGEAARELAFKKYTWSAIADRQIELYRQLLR